MVDEVRIRLRFSSIVNYLAILYRMVIAVGFVVIVARRLSVSEFGFLGVIISLTTILSTPASLWNYWTQRYLARGINEAGMTSLVLTLLYSLLATPILLLLGFIFNRALNLDLSYVVVSIPLLWLNAYNMVVTGISTAVKPELIGFRNFVYETLRLILALILVACLRTGLVGAIASLTIALVVSNVYALAILKKVINFRFCPSWDIAKEWFRGFPIPILNVAYSFLVNGVRAFASLITGSEVPTAYLNVGFSTYSPLISAARATTPALYARVLRQRSALDVVEVIRIFILINSLLFSTFIALSRTIASLYNPVYVSAWVIVVTLSIFGLLEGLRSIFFMVVIGSSRVDVSGIRSVKQIVRSDLFKASLIRVVASSLIYLVGFITVLMFRGDHLVEALGFSIGIVVATLVTIPWYFIKALRYIRFKVPWREVITGLIAGSIVIGYALAWRLNKLLILSFWRDITSLIPHLIVMLSIYLITWYLLSPWFRNLARLSLRYLVRTLHIE